MSNVIFFLNLINTHCVYGWIVGVRYHVFQSRICDNGNVVTGKSILCVFGHSVRLNWGNPRNAIARWRWPPPPVEPKLIMVVVPNQMTYNKIFTDYKRGFFYWFFCTFVYNDRKATNILGTSFDFFIQFFFQRKSFWQEDKEVRINNR